MRQLLLGILTIALAGCGGPVNTGILTGTVSYQGEPLTSGTVLVKADDGRAGNANIHEDGTYRIETAPAGAVKLAVMTFPPSPAVVPPNTDPKTIKQPSLKYTKLPEHYHDFATAGLSTTVEAGKENHFDVHLKK